MRRDLALVILLAVAAFGIRTYPAWEAVFGADYIRFLETDAWYHVRLVENQVRNYPWRVTTDPFAAPGGQFVPIAPLFDTLTATVVTLVHGRDATSAQVERTAALMPPVLGALAIVALWALARSLFGRRAGLLAAALLAVLPGHFMDRTMLGFVDHHALEALLALAVLLAISRALATAGAAPVILAGIALGAYLLTWGSGAFLIAIIGLWLAAAALLARQIGDATRAAKLTAIAAGIALALVVAFQHPGMHRYGSQILGLAGLALLSTAMVWGSRQPLGLPPRVAMIAAIAALAAAGFIAVAAFARDLTGQLLIDVARLAPDPTRMGVLEARPLFLYTGQWSWAQPWAFFRTGVIAGAVALVPFGVRVWRHRSLSDLLVLLFMIATMVATIGQNRFGYYFVTACALLGGWLAVEILDWGGVPHADNHRPAPRTRLPLARELAVVAVAGGMFAPNLAPSVLLSERRANYPRYWYETMQWLRTHTPAPFAARGDDYFYARYDAAQLPLPDYAVLSWWDQGYWITQQAHRVPVANPTQHNAPVAARFYTATDEGEAIAIVEGQRARFVVSDYELPYRRTAEGVIMGRFQTILDWANADHDRFYQVVYRRERGRWAAVWLFYEPYYRSMAFRLSVLGAAAAAGGEIAVVTLADRIDNNGFRFREIVGEETFVSLESARRATAASPNARLVGFDPWRSPFPIEHLQAFAPVHVARTPEQQPHEAPWVRVFEVLRRDDRDAPTAPRPSRR